MTLGYRHEQELMSTINGSRPAEEATGAEETETEDSWAAGILRDFREYDGAPVILDGKGYNILDPAYRVVVIRGIKTDSLLHATQLWLPELETQTCNQVLHGYAQQPSSLCDMHEDYVCVVSQTS